MQMGSKLAAEWAETPSATMATQLPQTSMRKTLFSILLLLGSALLLHAQEGNPGADKWRGPSGPSTIRGCLRATASYTTVTEDSGRVIALTGDTGRLGRYNRHEVEITGQPTVLTIDTTMQNAASTVEEVPAIKVKSVKELSRTCGWLP